MTSHRDSVTALLVAIWRTLRSPEWLSAVGDEEERAALLALSVADALNGSAPTTTAVRREFGRARRNVRIKRQFDGANYSTIAERHGLSVRQVRRIVHGQ